jgi:hypothetical protein
MVACFVFLILLLESLYQTNIITLRIAKRITLQCRLKRLYDNKFIQVGNGYLLLFKQVSKPLFSF